MREAMMGRYRLFAAFVLFWLAAAILGVVRGGFVPWFLTGSLGALLIYALLIPALCLKGASAAVSLSGEKTAAGESVQVKLELRLSGRIPLPWLTVRSVWKDGAGRDRYRSTRLLEPGRRRTVGCRYAIRDLERGIYRLDSIDLVTGDLFGLMTVSKRLPLDGVLTVLPRPCPLSLTDGRADSGSALRADGGGAAGTGPFAGLRAYQPGDPLRLIHWPATARTGSLQSAQRDAERSDRLSVILCGSRADRFEAEVAVAAGILAAAFASGVRPAFACAPHLRPAAQRGLPVSAIADWEELQVELAGLLSPAGSEEEGRTAFAAALRQAVSEGPPGFPVYAVTASPDEAAVQACGELARHRRTVLIHVLAREERDAAHARWEAELIRRGCAYRTVLLPADGEGGARHGGIA